jgi:hypothetical protein
LIHTTPVPINRAAVLNQMLDFRHASLAIVLNGCLRTVELTAILKIVGEFSSSSSGRPISIGARATAERSFPSTAQPLAAFDHTGRIPSQKRRSFSQKSTGVSLGMH